VAQFSLVEMQTPMLLAVPNVSEGRNAATVSAIERAFTDDGDATRLLDRHSDADHHRTVYTLAGAPETLAQALLRGARETVQRIDINDGRRGVHPHVGAMDVVPVVYLEERARGAACAEALAVADMIGGLGVPVYLYGELAAGRSRAELRRGGVRALAQRMGQGERPDFGPWNVHPRAGATLVAARAPLVAFNLELAAPATVVEARRIASVIREGGEEGLAGVRAIGVCLKAGLSRKELLSVRAELWRPRAWLRHSRAGLRERRRRGTVVAQVSMNVERPAEVPLRVVVQAVRRHAEVECAELVGMAPRAALEGFPAELWTHGFDPERHVIENALGL
jgi:glutamate formiminotransferase / 5-formyltetrahydrofolate cyclo-ligase